MRRFIIVRLPQSGMGRKDYLGDSAKIIHPSNLKRLDGGWMSKIISEINGHPTYPTYPTCFESLMRKGYIGVIPDSLFPIGV